MRQKAKKLDTACAFQKKQLHLHRLRKTHRLFRGDVGEIAQLVRAHDS